MTLLDISRALNARIAVWPGDSPFNIQQIASLAKGDSVNLTTLTLSAHTGAHVDAPYHFDKEGATIGEMDLQPFWGPAQVAAVSRESGPLTPDDFAHINLTLAPRLLIRSSASQLDPTQFPERFVYPSPELVEHLAGQGIILYGSDTPSMDAADSKELPGHHALYRHGIAILEGLDLSGVADGLYELAALPLKIEGGDGSPVRAVLRTI